MTFELTKCDGDSTTHIRKKKLCVIYDYELKIKFKGQVRGGDNAHEVSGVVNYELTVDDDDPDYTFKLNEDLPFKRKVETALLGAIADKCRVFVDELTEKGNGPAQPQGFASGETKECVQVRLGDCAEACARRACGACRRHVPTRTNKLTAAGRQTISMTVLPGAARAPYRFTKALTGPRPAHMRPLRALLTHVLLRLESDSLVMLLPTRWGSTRSTQRGPTAWPTCKQRQPRRVGKASSATTRRSTCTTTRPRTDPHKMYVRGMT